MHKAWQLTFLFWQHSPTGPYLHQNTFIPGINDYWVVEALVDHSVAISILTETESATTELCYGNQHFNKKITAFKITTSFPGHCPSCQGGFVICLQRALENLVFLSSSIIWGFLFLGLLRQVLLLSPGSYLSILNTGIAGVHHYALLVLFISHCHVVWHANVWVLHLAWQTIIQLPNYFRVTSAPQILLYSSK